MLHWIRDLADISARFLETLGTAIIVLGGLAASAAFVRDLRRGASFDASYKQYRRGLGRAILLGLEFLVGADIISTVAVEPNYRNVGVLALIVVIRTFLSFSLEVEIEGRWPWQGRNGQERGGSEV
jgi:uncharacterized membrane protein